METNQTNLHWKKDKEHSDSCNKYLDEIYRKIWDVKKITRIKECSDLFILDKNFGIDVIIRLSNGMIISGQEKIRRKENIKWNDFTLEYKSNKNGQFGEHFYICADFYTYGYGNSKDGLEAVKIFKIYPVKIAIQNGILKGQYRENKKHSTASFYAYSFNDFKKDWFIHESVKQKIVDNKNVDTGITLEEFIKNEGF